MLFCFGLFALLLYNTVVANAVCSYTYFTKTPIQADSKAYEKRGHKSCEFVIKAPGDSFIELNFTEIELSGFSNKNMTVISLKATHKDKDCLPPEIVIKEISNGEEIPVSNICSDHDSNIPQVFQSHSSVLKITFYWVLDHTSGFKLDFDFHRKQIICAFSCEDSTCLPDKELVCNNIFDCLDKSDENNCDPDSPNTGADKSSTSDFIKVIVIGLAVILLLMPALACIIYLLTHRRLPSRLCNRQTSRDSSAEHTQLHPQSQSSEITYVPSSSGQDSSSQDVALLLEKQTMNTTMPPCLDLPPHVPVSRDGEEGYYESQKQIALQQSRRPPLIFRPPPNKTVHDRESPPPYNSNSATSLDRSGCQSPVKCILDADGYPIMIRCNSLSTDNNNVQNHSHSGGMSHSWTPSSIIGGHSRNDSSSSRAARQSYHPPGDIQINSFDSNLDVQRS